MNPFILIFSLYFIIGNNSFAITVSSYPEQLHHHGDTEIRHAVSKTSVAKITRSKNLTQAMHEYELHKKVHKAIETHSVEHVKKHACVVEPQDFLIKEGIALFTMEKLYPLNETTELLRLNLGTEVKNYKSRKNYLKIKAILDEYPLIKSHPSKAQENIDILCYDLGYTVALMHFSAKVDGVGTKVFLAKASKRSQKTYKIALANFKRSHSLEQAFTDYDVFTVVRGLFNSMVKNQDYPTPNHKGFIFFKNGYRSCAQALDALEKTTLYSTIAEQVLALYESSAGHYKPRRLMKASQKNHPGVTF